MSKIMLISPKDNNFYNFRSELILKLHEMGNEVILVCPYGKKIDFFTERGCRFIDVSMDRRGTSIINDLKLVRAYAQLLKVERPSVVLTYTSKPSIYAGFVCGIMKIPYIVNNAGLMETRGLFDIFMKILYKIGWSKASCMMYQNTQERDVIQKIVGKKMHYRDIPGSGVNIEAFPFTEYPENDETITFNYVARIVQIKGIDEFLECARIVRKKHKNVRFVLYGDYDDEHYYTKVEALQKEGIVKYGGVQIDMKPYIASAHAVIHPSYYEGMTNVVLEHSSMGRPCIGSNIPGVREGIDDGKTGFLFEVKNVDSMVRAVERFLLLTHDEKKAMGRAARIKMETEFKREIVTDIYIEEINKIIGE
uniref:glycosyltransferase family 4 protein n=1 Tax=Coprococcus catus TaxID=116085 RepID=UPI0002FD6700|nr:glycosyltransferase family 4 protein [Coprococcus catus]